MENLIDSLYFVILILCFVFSIVASVLFYNRDKHKLIKLSKKFKNGWGLYKVKFKKVEDNFNLIPNKKEDCLYYCENLKYEERIEKVVGKKKTLDIKFYPKNEEKVYHNDVIISVLNQEIKTNTENLTISLDKHINDAPNVSLNSNARVLFMEESEIKEDKDYYAMIEISNKKINLNDIRISDEQDNFKYDFYFHLGVLWFPSIAFLLFYLFIR